MLKKTMRILILLVIISNGLLFTSNIYVLGDHKAAIAMHNDLAPDTGAFFANVKVITCFVVGILYLITAVGIIRKKKRLSLAGVLGSSWFVGLYIFQLIIWSRVHPRIWTDFIIFGSLSIIIGIYSYIQYQKEIRIQIQSA